VLVLAATNLVIVLAFGALYGAAGARLLSQRAFLVDLAVLFALLTALWLRVEGGQGRGLDPIRRLGRVAIGLVAVLIGAPVLVLLPLFGLEAILPPGAGPDILPLAPAMALLLITLALAVVVNLTGGLLLVGTAVVLRVRTRGA
jgi:hypothetical protein